MKYMQSIQGKAATVFLSIGLMVFFTGMLSLLHFYRMTNTSDHIVQQAIPTIRGAQQMLLAMSNAQQVIHRAATQQGFQSIDAVRKEEAEFNRAILTYNLFATAITLGSETEAFRLHDGGIPHGSWQRKRLNKKFVIPPANDDVRGFVEVADGWFKSFANQGQEFLRQKKKALRLQFIGSHAEAEILERDIAVKLDAIEQLSTSITRTMEGLVEQNDIIISGQIRDLHRTQTPLLVALIFSLVLILGVLILSLKAIRNLMILPIQALTKIAQNIANGNLSMRCDFRSNDEIGFLARSFNNMASKLQESHEHLSDKVQEQTKELSQKIREAEDQNTAILNIMEDLDETKSQMEEEAQNARKFQQAVEASTNAIAITNPELKFVYVNPAWQKLTNFTEEEALGQTPHILVSDKTKPEVIKAMQKSIGHGRAFHSEDFIYERNNGGEYYAELTAYPIKEEKETLFYVLIHDDITKRKRLDSAKSEFVSLASHQLRTPLTAIRWAMGRLKRDKDKHLNKHEEKCVNTAHNAAARMADTISTMLMISRLEAGKIILNHTDVALNTVLDELVEESRSFAESKQIDVSIECADDLHLETDPQVLREIIANLISNAIKYTPKEGTVSLKANKQKNGVQLAVSDTGYGIPLQQQDQVFSKFFRAENVLNKEESGTGLGLYLVHSLVNLLSGKISFDSEENKGTTFSLFFPLSPSLS